MIFFKDRIFISALSGKSQRNHGMVLVVRNHLLEVPVQLGGELLVPEGAALLVKDFVDGGDQLQLLLSAGGNSTSKGSSLLSTCDEGCM